jgi:hypothetical protein
MWAALVTLRNRRAGEALDLLRDAESSHRQAEQAETEAAIMFQRAEHERRAQQARLYDAVAGQVVPVHEIMKLRDGVENLARATDRERSRLEELADAHARAADSVGKASAFHGERRRAAEKAVDLARRLDADHARRDALLAEVELEDVSVMMRAFSRTGSRHAG